MQISHSFRSPKALSVFVTPLAAFCFLGFMGCETTDYEPLIMKKKLQALEEKIDRMGDADQEKLEARITELEKQLKSLGNSGASAKPGVAAEPDAAPLSAEDRLSLIGEIEAVDGYVSTNENDEVWQVDLSTATYDNGLVEKLQRIPGVKHLLLNGAHTDLDTFKMIGQMRSLENLSLEKSPATAQAMAQLTSLQNLKFLQLFRSDVSDEAFEFIAKIPNLEQVRCGQTRISDAALKHLEGSQTIRALDLMDCNRVSDLGLKYLESVPRLAFLKVWGPQITDAGMASVGKMKGLKVLGLNDTGVTDSGIEKLSGLNLREIYLFRTKVGDSAMKVFAGMPEMITMTLRDTQISDAGVESLTALKKLAKLDLSETNSPGVTDASGASFAKMPQLKQLNLWDTKVGDQTVSQLVALQQLHWLNLDKTKISDASVQLLEEFPALDWVHLGSTGITDKSVEALLNLENLKYLNVSFTGITEDRFYDLYDAFSEKDCELIGP